MVERRTILLVEDDPVQREVLGLLLAGEGWEVAEAEDGEAALRWLERAEHAPSLVLCDLQMPGLRGAALAEALRKVPRRPESGTGMVILAMSATVAEVAVPGYDGVLAKPVRVAGLAGWLVAGKRPIADSGGADGREPEPEDSSAPETAQDVPVVDTEIWRRLQLSMPMASLKGLGAMAMADVESRVERMRLAMAAGEDAAYRREAHTLKGSAGMIGARRLSELAAEAERLGCSPGVYGSKVVSTEAVISRLLSECKALRLMLEVLLIADTGSVQQGRT